MVITIPLHLLVRFRGCFILNLVNYVWPCNLEGLFDLPRWYFYIGALDASTTCKSYASHVLHPSWCIVVMKWGIPWMSQVLDWSPALRFSLLLSVALAFCLYPLLDSFWAMVNCFFVFYSTCSYAVIMVCENPWWLLSNHLMLNLFSSVTYAVTAYI